MMKFINSEKNSLPGSIIVVEGKIKSITVSLPGLYPIVTWAPEIINFVRNQLSTAITKNKYISMIKKIIDKVALICFKNQKVLSTQSKNINCWYLPGGKREPGESDHTCLKREITEELSVSLINESLIHFKVFKAQAHGLDNGIIVQMTCYFGDYSGLLKPGNEIAIYDWLTFAHRNACSAVDQLIFDELKFLDLLS